MRTIAAYLRGIETKSVAVFVIFSAGIAAYLRGIETRKK